MSIQLTYGVFLFDIETSFKASELLNFDKRLPTDAAKECKMLESTEGYISLTDIILFSSKILLVIWRIVDIVWMTKALKAQSRSNAFRITLYLFD